MYKFEFAVSSARQIERWTHLVLPSHANICGMATILPGHYHHSKYKLPGEHQGDLDDQED